MRYAVGVASDAAWVKNAPATFYRVVAHVMHARSAYAPHHFYDWMFNAKAEDGLREIESHKLYSDVVLQNLGDAWLYVYLQKCVIMVSEIPVLGCNVEKYVFIEESEKK